MFDKYDVAVKVNIYVFKQIILLFSQTNALADDEISLTFSCLDFVNTNVQAYFKGILFHYYKDFPCILIYCWKGNIIENLNLLNKKKSEVT